MIGLFHEAEFWVSVSFVLFFVLFGSKIWKPLSGMLDSRATRIRAELDEAGTLRREAEQMLEDATREREQAFVEAQALVEQARKQAEALAVQARADAEAVIRRREQMARDRIASAERAALEEVRSAAIEIAFEGARGLIAGGVQTATAEAMIDQAIAGLPAALAGKAA